MSTRVCEECFDLFATSSEYLTHYQTIHATSAITCTVCERENLDTHACFNCKGLKECVFCCGCEE